MADSTEPVSDFVAWDGTSAVFPPPPPATQEQNLLAVIANHETRIAALETALSEVKAVLDALPLLARQKMRENIEVMSKR